MRRLLAACIVLAVAAGAAVTGARGTDSPPSQVFRPTSEKGPLEGKIAWALGEAGKAGPGRTFWAGYSIQRLTGENSHIGSYSTRRGRALTVADVLAGQTGPASPSAAAEGVREAAKAEFDRLDEKGRPKKTVLKDLGILFKYETGRPAALKAVKLTDLDLSFDFEGAPLYWLGPAPAEESLGVIRRLFEKASGRDVAEGLVAAAGCHGTPRLVVPFLKEVLAGDRPDDLRRDAAFWLGQQDDAEALRILVDAARSDRSSTVREGAVFSISQVGLPSAADEIIALARNAGHRDVRKQAIFWLGQMASERTGATLEEFARKDGDIEVQEQAVFALSQLEDNRGVDALIRLAKSHPDPRIRKKAVFWLGECDDPRALEALIAIVKGK